MPNRLARSHCLRAGFVACVVITWLLACGSRLDDLKAADTEPDGPGIDLTDAGIISPPELTCNNGDLDGSETAKDCGGQYCPACGLGLSCLVNSDCESYICDETCLAAGCDNDAQDESESDVDCGGSCSPCDDGKSCGDAADCQSRVCEAETCQVPTCDDEQANGLESGVDCGGESDCPRCADGEGCGENGDCESDFCSGDTCADPGCGDGDQNSEESDVDCGGSCPGCDEGLRCNDGSDCKSEVCEADETGVMLCQAARCDDGVTNGSETDEDCGGDCPTACDIGQRCDTGDDCIEKACRRESSDSAKLCQEPSCDDEARNGDESAIDCGGSCDACDDGKTCSEHADCASNSCDEVCLAATCNDDRQNQGESATDCGGPECSACGFGKSCGTAEDCSSTRCDDELCSAGGFGLACAGDEDCISGDCTAADTCASSRAEEGCYEDADCTTDNCLDGICEKSLAGEVCEVDADCHSDFCSENACTPGNLGDVCEGGSDCYSGMCDETCQPIDLTIETDPENPDTSTVLLVNFRVRAGTVSVTWDEVAFLYFFTPDNFADIESNFVEYGINNGLVEVNTVGVTTTDWVFSLRSTNPDPIAFGTFATFRHELRNEPWLADFNDTGNDYSFGTTGWSANDNVVVCRNVGGLWSRVKGTPPNAISDPCQYMTPNCANVYCDDPQAAL